MASGFFLCCLSGIGPLLTGLRLEQFQRKWTPVPRPELRKNKDLAHCCDSTKNGNALRLAGLLGIKRGNQAEQDSKCKDETGINGIMSKTDIEHASGQLCDKQ